MSLRPRLTCLKVGLPLPLLCWQRGATPGWVTAGPWSTSKLKPRAFLCLASLEVELVEVEVMEVDTVAEVVAPSVFQTSANCSLLVPSLLWLLRQELRYSWQSRGGGGGGGVQGKLGVLQQC